MSGTRKPPPETTAEWNMVLTDESEEQAVAYRTFRDLGPERSYNRLMQTLLHPRSRRTYQIWRLEMFWDERVRLYESGMGEPQGMSIAALPSHRPGSLDDVATQMEAIMGNVLCALDTVFQVGRDGVRRPKFEIDSARDFQILTKTLGDLVTIQLEIHKARERAAGYQKDDQLAKAVDKMVGSLTTAQLIDAIKGGEVGVRDGVETPTAAADYTDVPTEGVEDSGGRDAVCHGVGTADCGDEA